MNQRFIIRLAAVVGAVLVLASVAGPSPAVAATTAAAAITLKPPVGPPTTKVQAKGSGFVAGEPVAMARAFSLGVEAGRQAFVAGRATERMEAEPSSPLTGFLERLHSSQADPAVTSP